MPTRTRTEPARPAGAARLPDRHLLYTPAVQDVDHDIEQLIAIYRRARGSVPTFVREDFCGTAALACAWVRGGPRRHAWGLDLHSPTLDWARRRRLPYLGTAATRVTLIHSDVRTRTRPGADVITALNFSYWVFRTRGDLRDYFTAARRSLRPGGMLMLDAFGGNDATRSLIESRRVPASQGPGDERIPRFTFVWEQETFNPVDHRLCCHIHFRLGPRRVMRRAFSYDWRMWTLPELREILAEAGFRESLVYIQDWDDDAGQPLGSYSVRTRFENQAGWLGYVVGLR